MLNIIKYYFGYVNFFLTEQTPVRELVSDEKRHGEQDGEPIRYARIV